MDQTNLTFTLAGSRNLGYALYGSSSSDATPILYFHGCISSRYEAAILAPHALALNIKIISIDRPGMGLSTFQDDRRVLDWPGDILELTNALNIKTFSIFACSGGAIYAFACAHMIPFEKLKVVEVMGGAYPKHVEAGILKPFQKLLSGSISHLAGSAISAQWGSKARDPDPTRFYEECEKEMVKRPEVDQKSLKGYEKIALYDPMREAFRGDGKAIGLDLKLTSPDVGKWGFKLVDVRSGDGFAKIKLWHGARDENTPVAMAQQIAGELRCDLQVVEDQGHMGIPIHYAGVVLKDILSKLHIG